MRRSGGAQFLISRIIALLILTIGILVSQTAAKPQSDNDQLAVIQTQHFTTTDEIENFPSETTTSFSNTTSSPRKRVTREVKDSYTETPGVGRHKIHSNAATWHEARKICQKEGGDLAVVNSKTESQTLAKLIAKSYPHYDSYNSYFVSIGFDDLDEEGKYVTIDGKSLKEAGFAEWFWGQPDNSQQWGGENCGSIHKGGRLNDVPCHKKFAFACELPLVDEENFPRETTTSFSHTTSSPRKRVTTEVQNSYTYTPGVGVHKIHRQAEKWQDARKICQAEGGDLAIINSQTESQVLAELLANSYPHSGSANKDHVLIGLNDLDEEGKHLTIDGKTPKEAGFAVWAGGQPDNNWRWGGENCGSLYKSGTLNDISCNEKYAFACELSMCDQVCPPGPAGPPGIPGIKGEAGVPGPAGRVGPKGEPGAKGTDGMQGVAGEKGSKGDTGSIGSVGVKGDKGDSGQVGPSGPPGPRGKPGLGYDAVCSAVLSVLEQIQGPGLIDGGEVRIFSEDDTILKECQEFMTKTYGQDSAGGSSQNPAKRNGGRESPAKTCKDLFIAYPDKPSGEYWIDPNGDDVSDAVLVRCDAGSYTTCVTPESSRSPKISYTGDKQEVWLSEIDDELQITYTADANQMTALQLLSRHAEQNVTYHCVKSVGYFDSESQSNERGLKLLAWNDVELGPRGSRQFRYDVISDSCRDRLDEWKETVIAYQTDKAGRLPVTDVGLRDVGKPGQSFAVEIGEVCFG